jgi:hypothetical protein
MALDTTRLFQNYVDKDRDAVTLLVAKSLLALALESDPVTKLTEQYREGITAPSVDFFCYPSTRLTANGDTVLPSPFKPGAKILVKHLAASYISPCAPCLARAIIPLRYSKPC